MKIKINGNVYKVLSVYDDDYLPCLTMEDGSEFYVAKNFVEAGNVARKCWKDLVENDPEEFVCLVGSKVLVNWAMGISDGPGTTAVKSLEEWLNLWLDTPEEQFASYDGGELGVDACDKSLLDQLGFRPRVAYRRG